MQILNTYKWMGLKAEITALLLVLAVPVSTFAQSTNVAVEVARAEISKNVSSFSYRDQTRWAELRDLFTKDATISISWHDGTVDGFVERSSRMVEEGAPGTKHWISPPRITVCGNRALSEADVIIIVRSSAGLIELDITSYTRFYDQFELEGDGVWRIHNRTGIYEKDRIDSVSPSFLFWVTYLFMPLSKYPKEFRHLAFGLERNNLSVMPNVVTSGSDRERTLKQKAWEWSGCSATSGARQP
ncbi:nuclear transport factor 2 family protein [Leptospira sp. 'Mane']|uniref:nuclear transport factor 2 family protein n=1 Tax=Leptospira sp. 'Mane' TaxID=3387407 RepID=UPI00398B13C6